MFKEDEVKQLQALFGRFTNTVEFSLHGTEENEFGRKLENLVAEVCRLSDGKCVVVSKATDSPAVVAPGFTVGRGGQSSIVYAALPTGHQFPPFLKILETLGSDTSPIAGNDASSDRSRAELLILISDSCPRCPLVVEAAGISTCENPSILTCIADVMQFQEFVKEYKIQSVPATVLDRKIVLIGALSADRIMELVRSRGTPKFEIERIGSLIERQNIEEAAASLEGEAGRTVVLDLLQDVEFSKRLSGLVVVEKALENNPDAVRAMVPSLLPMLTHDDARIRGDIADLLGKIGDPQAIPQLEPLTRDPDPDVAEAAADALEELKE
ncbi:MAG: HEAT repeat domain-containing protein [Acidobacteria bacterium]|nr:HEAT repeat domain-containing protein [Acidobacteriota bacterium]